ncbi:Endo-1,3-1,4-beta-glycanase ExsH [Aquisphaera giovannonii]|uniref:Endo-1,3-1,4-beta-glycanase ExsH n=1 Tax=Aquisphaera giovannonii TaxID=406548 RepID=A0A5B9WA65_9BACT|nr:family 16 glycosylhydrolase [Aquisphaera giovannonii]QEH37426.1 Endo-1,3-1,4-beta-glycanase ExsH [Aquisphaera giovannonii]
MRRTLLMLFAACGVARAADRQPIVVEDFDDPRVSRSVWVVNIPDDNASVRLTGEGPHQGKSCLELRYRFVATGNFQYLGVPIAVKILAPIHRLRYWVHGDGSGCSYGVQITDARGETHQFSRNTGQGGTLDPRGWREVVVPIDEGHETWGGDKDGKLDYPITGITFTVGQPKYGEKLRAAEGTIRFDAMSVESDKGAAETLGARVDVVSPEYGSDVKGDTKVVVSAPGFETLMVKCWQAGAGHGEDSAVATVALDAKGGGSFLFPADRYPHGPITVRIRGEAGGLKDNCYLQLYNRGGISWREGIPSGPPPAAEGLRLIFADDFHGELSVSGTDPKATYYDHKPPNGYQDFSVHTFSDFHSPKNPFRQVDGYLRIRADDRTHASGLLSSIKNDGSGIKARVPCYFEARLFGPNAVGTWPGFWLMTDYMTDFKAKGDKAPVDELDIIEAYGGEGHGSPNAFDSYMVTPHCWNQGEEGKAMEKKAFEGLRNPIKMGKFGIPSAWFEAFHTYGCKITEVDTVYYCDDVEVGRHPTFPVSRANPHFFMINLATGGGWPVDLSRYHGIADMYIDYIRVYGR